MKNTVYFEVVDLHTDWAWNRLHSTESEARQEVEHAKAEGEYEYPAYIRKTTLKRNAKGKVIRKITENVGLA